MTLRWLRRGIGAGRATALLALVQCGVPLDPGPFADEGSSADDENEDGKDDDRDDEDVDEESTGSPGGDADSAGSTTRTSSSSDTGSDDVTSGAGTSTGSSDGMTTTTGNTSIGWTSSTSFTGGMTTFGGEDTSDSMSTSGSGDSMGEGGTGDPPVELDCDAPMPSSGAQMHSGNGRGGDGNLAWEIWSNTMRGELVTYDVPAFSAIWNEAGGYLGRLGYEWGQWNQTPVPHEQVGTITAQFASNKSGQGGLYSYVGMYGWTTDPCIEWYVIEDSFNNMPVNPGSGEEVTRIDVDGGTYIVYLRPTQGTGGSRCSAGETTWNQYYSIRTTARSCGTISLSEHFKAWEAQGLEMGNLLEAKILVEVGGSSGRVDLPVANVMVTPP